MFSSSKKQMPPAPPARKGAPSIISAGLAIAGNLTTEDELQVDGVVEGDIVAGRLTLGAESRVKGEIAAEHVIVHGEVQGAVRARMVELSKSARVSGDIWHESLSIEAGARVEGVLKNAEYRRPGAEPAHPREPFDTGEPPIRLAGA
jgi:cytoskeletal protein CcmA (bactofilin family)